MCTRPGNVFTAACCSAITSDSNFMGSSCRPQSELRWLLGLTHCHHHCQHVCSPTRKGHEDLTSSTPSSGLSSAVLPECPTECWQLEAWVALVAGLNQHLTTRADDSHAAPVYRSAELKKTRSLGLSGRCQGLVRFCALLRIKPHAPPLVRAPSIPLSFNLATVLPRRNA